MTGSTTRPYRIHGIVRDAVLRKSDSVFTFIPIPKLTIGVLDRITRKLLGSAVTAPFDADQPGAFDIEFNVDEQTAPAASIVLSVERFSKQDPTAAEKKAVLLESGLTILRGEDVQVEAWVVGFSSQEIADSVRAGGSGIANQTLNASESERPTYIGRVNDQDKLNRKRWIGVRKRFRSPAPVCMEGFQPRRERTEEELVTRQSKRRSEARRSNTRDERSFFTDNFIVRYVSGSAKDSAAIPGSSPRIDKPLTLSDGHTLVGIIRARQRDLHHENTENHPSYVQKIGLAAEFGLRAFIAAGFRDPCHGRRLEIRIADLQVAGEKNAEIGGQTRSDWDHMEIGAHHNHRGRDSDNHIIAVVAHELFHRVQYEYNDALYRSYLSGVIREGGARLIEDFIDDDVNRYVTTSGNLLRATGQSLQDWPVWTGADYAASLFLRYLCDQYGTFQGRRDLGIDAYRRVLEATATVRPTDPGNGYQLAALRTARSRMSWYGTLDEFVYGDMDRCDLMSHETAWGNFLLANYLHGKGQPLDDLRFDYVEDDDIVIWQRGKPLHSAAAEVSEEIGPIRSGSKISRTVVGQGSCAARYFMIKPSRQSRTHPAALRIEFAASGGLIDPLIQIVTLGRGDKIIDIWRSDRTTYSRVITLVGVTSVLVVVATRDTGGDFTVKFHGSEKISDVMVTRWNCVAGKSYEIDPYGWTWTWLSPDVKLRRVNGRQKLCVRLRNFGTKTAEHVSVDFWRQRATPHLLPFVYHASVLGGRAPAEHSGWLPLANDKKLIRIADARIPAGGKGKWFEVDWPDSEATAESGEPIGWCVKAIVTSPGDVNTDNKTVISQLVIDLDAKTSRRVAQLLRHYKGSGEHQFHVAPRGRTWTLSIPSAWITAFNADRASPPNAWWTSTRILPMPDRIGTLPMTLRRLDRNVRAWNVKTRGWNPRANLYYPVPQQALPDGMSRDKLITVTQVLNGNAIGGVTYRISKSGRLGGDR